MTLHKSTVKINYNKKRGSATIYIKTEFTPKMLAKFDPISGEKILPGFIPNKDLLAIFDDEAIKLCITEL